MQLDLAGKDERRAKKDERRAQKDATNKSMLQKQDETNALLKNLVDQLTK